MTNMCHQGVAEYGFVIILLLLPLLVLIHKLSSVNYEVRPENMGSQSESSPLTNRGICESLSFHCAFECCKLFLTDLAILLLFLFLTSMESPIAQSVATGWHLTKLRREIGDSNIFSAPELVTNSFLLFAAVSAFRTIITAYCRDDSTKCRRVYSICMLCCSVSVLAAVCTAHFRLGFLLTVFTVPLQCLLCAPVFYSAAVARRLSMTTSLLLVVFAAYTYNAFEDGLALLFKQYIQVWKVLLDTIVGY
jgi:hypothetical protein